MGKDCFFPSPHPREKSTSYCLKILPLKVTRLEIIAMQSNKTHDANKLGEKNVLSLKDSYFTVKFLLSLPRRLNKINLWTHAYYCSYGPQRVIICMLECMQN